MEYGLIGEKLGHSYSQMIHARLADYRYELKEVAPERLDAFIEARNFRGLNVTIPYKQAVMKHCAELSPEAMEVGSVNTLIMRPDGSLFGHNTDIDGFIYMLRRGEIDPAGAKAVILGSGGTSLTARAALTRLGAREIVTVSRKGPVDYAALYAEHADAEILVNATPVGMYPNCPASPVTKVTLSQMKSLVGVLDVVYNPTRTGICLDAEDLGIANESGLAMLVGQALFASELFQGHELEHAIATDILDDSHASTGNIVLIGMPGSGKSSCGRQLGKICGREHIDLDDAFSERFGKSPADVIRESGEDEFREMETEVLSTYASRSGLVLSTGGGVVTRPENYRLMHQNGTIVMLDRPLNELSSKGRPISQASGVEELARRRMPLYVSWADMVVTCTGSARGDALEIIKRLSI